MSEWLDGDVIANGIRIHYHRTGGGRPPLVLSHGFSDAGLCWTRLARALEADYDVIMPDARGHGLSEAPEGGYDSETRAADLAELIRALGLNKPAVAGHSMGASTVLTCAALYPDLMRCAILEDGGIRQALGQGARAEQEARMARIRQTAQEQRTMTREQLIARCRQQNPTWDEVEIGPWADAKLRLSPNALNMRPGSERLTWQEALARVTCPVLLVTADPDRGAMVTPEAAAEAQRILPTLKVVRLHGAGHNVRREQFDAFTEAVRTFLVEQ